MRTPTITAAEWVSVQDGTLWLVREGVPDQQCAESWPEAASGEYNPKCCRFPKSCSVNNPGPPAEFVQACAPCEVCQDDRTVGRDCDLTPRPCPDCRIELVGECDRCRGSSCPVCFGIGTVTLGHAYAVGSPLPIAGEDDFSPEWQMSHRPVVIIANPRRPASFRFPKIVAWPDPLTEPTGIILDDRLAHAGPPESLVGKWAMQLKVVGS